MENKYKYDSLTIGTVTEVKARGLDFPTRITVEYVVNGKSYSVSESIKLKSKAIKLGFLPIGQERVPVMGDTRVGAKTEVLYCSSNPSDAIIKENRGKQNV